MYKFPGIAANRICYFPLVKHLPTPAFHPRVFLLYQLSFYNYEILCFLRYIGYKEISILLKN
jgi:hypothetical protein